MKITFRDQTQVSYDILDTPVRGQRAERKREIGFAGAIASFDGADRAVSEKENKGIFSKRGQDGQQNDPEKERQRIASTMTFQDFRRMLKEGLDPEKTDEKEVVTILDKIKAELIKSGQQIIGYTDDMNMDVLSAALGSEQLAAGLVRECRQADLPITDENVKEVEKALSLSAEWTDFTEEQKAFLIENVLEATIYNLSLSMASGAGSAGEVRNSGISGEELTGFLDRIGVEPTAENLECAGWLLEKGLDINPENIEKKQALDRLEFPLSPELVIRAGVGALLQGKEGVDGDLTRPESVWEKSVRIWERYTGPDAEKRIDQAIVREEVRLHMTVDANKALLESGFAIDTRPIEETLEALKELRRQYARELFPDAEDPEALADLYDEAETVLQEVSEAPAATVGYLGERFSEVALREFAEEGKQLAGAYRESGTVYERIAASRTEYTFEQTADEAERKDGREETASGRAEALSARHYHQAEERYEKGMTVPRRDLGDRIETAFRNVDELLKEMEYLPTEENRKAVRVMGYCRMEITPENLETVKEGLRTIEDLTQRMTPKAVLQMIRDGVNPLTATIGELKEYFTSLPEEYAQESEKYSRYLFHLEHNKEITQEEKSAYIGCFRLLRQIEKSDGAVIGDLLQQNAQLNLQNILTALRSRNARGKNVIIDDENGGVLTRTEPENSISEQIQRGFDVSVLRDVVASVYNEETQERYERQRYEDYRESLKQIADGAEQTLEQAGIESTPENLVAVSGLWEMEKMHFPSKKERTENRAETELSEFTKEYEEVLQEEKEAVETETFVKEERLDVRALQLLHKQLSVMEGLSPANEYYFTMGSEEQPARIRIRLAQDAEQRGMITLDIEGEAIGKLHGQLRVSDGKVSGYFLGNEPETVMKLNAMTDIFSRNLPKEVTYGRVDFIHEPSGRTKVSLKGETEARSENPAVLFKVAAGFLNSILAS